jgi:hypothetical protein
MPQYWPGTPFSIKTSIPTPRARGKGPSLNERWTIFSIFDHDKAQIGSLFFPSFAPCIHCIMFSTRRPLPPGALFLCICFNALMISSSVHCHLFWLVAQSSSGGHSAMYRASYSVWVISSSWSVGFGYHFWSHEDAVGFSWSLCFQ